MIVTIDGPSGTGKSTVAKLLAKRLGFSFFDTGAMYRSLVWWIHKKQIDLSDLEKVKDLLKTFPFVIEEGESGKRYQVGGFDVTEEIRQKSVTEAVSKISAIKEIRALLLPLQRDYAKCHDSVFEGRDLGTVVFPSADVKFFLTANPSIRGQRRYLELKAKDPHFQTPLEEVIASLQKRDEQDSGREIAPLKCPEDAIVVDTSFLSIEEVVEILLQNTLKKRKPCKDG
jgi:cytidylate kinase